MMILLNCFDQLIIHNFNRILIILKLYIKWNTKRIYYFVYVWYFIKLNLLQIYIIFMRFQVIEMYSNLYNI